MLDKIIGSRPEDWSTPNKAKIRLDAFTYVGIVKNNRDPLKKGRIKVYIPDLGGNISEDLITVSYASPFFGATPELADNKQINKRNEFRTVRHTYGMWMVPPDIDNQVLITFAGGDINKGYWFACVNSHLLSHGMTPALGSVLNWKAEGTTAGKTSKGNRYPATEFNENDDSLRGPNYLSLSPRPIHEIQFNQLVEQGLQDDTVRGTHSSSSQREAPSSTFGISTPGRSLPDTKSLYEQIVKGTVKVDEITPEDLKPKGRAGGHILVMDDGDFAGNDNMIKIRSSGGHQIIMHDSADTMYISNSKGSVWLELDSGGNLNIYTDGSFSVRAKGDVNFHSDSSINFSSSGNINIKARDAVKIEGFSVSAQTIGTTKIVAGFGVDVLGGLGVKLQSPLGIKLNSGIPILPEVPIPVQMVSDTVRQQGKWTVRKNILGAATSVVPTHEPWDGRGSIPTAAQLNQFETAERAAALRKEALAEAGYDEEIIGKNFTPEYGILSASRSTLGGNKLAPNKVSSQPDPIRNIPGLTMPETKALLAQLAHLESSNDYSKVNTLGYIGKYQFGAAALVDRGYIKPEWQAKYGNRALEYPDAWTGLNEINNRDQFLAAKELQEVVMQQQMEANLKTMLASGALKSSDDAETRAGMIAVAHLLGATGATNWRSTGKGQDANKTTGTDYFNYGRYAMQSLAPNTTLASTSTVTGG